MYYTGINPLDGKPVYVAKKGRDKAKQRALMQFKNIENYDLVKEALIEANRRDLIGFGPECLIPPRLISGNSKRISQSSKFRNGKRDCESRNRCQTGKRRSRDVTKVRTSNKSFGGRYM